MIHGVETYIKIKGKDAYLYRAVDSEGNTIDFFVSENRDKDAAKKFLRKALKAMHMIRKGQVEGIRCVLSEVEMLNRVMCEVA
jgi:transposase-like protein